MREVKGRRGRGYGVRNFTDKGDRAAGYAPKLAAGKRFSERIAQTTIGSGA